MTAFFFPFNFDRNCKGSSVPRSPSHWQGQRWGPEGLALRARPSASPSVERVALLPIHSSALTGCGIFASASTFTSSSSP